MTAHPAPPALLEALELVRAPRSARPRPDDRLPDGVFLLLRIAAGEEQAIESARHSCKESPEAIREAAVFYIQQVLFAPNADSYRVLGVDPDATDERLRESYRWLARWLHPDRNRNEWEAFFADRVNQAWQNLRTPERRARYDETRWVELTATPEVSPAFSTPIPMRGRAEQAPVADPARSLRWIPSAIFGSLAILAVATVAVFSAVQLIGPEQTTALGADDPTIEAPAALVAARQREASGPTMTPGASLAATADTPSVDSAAKTPAAEPTPIPVATPTPALDIVADARTLVEPPASRPAGRTVPRDPLASRAPALAGQAVRHVPAEPTPEPAAAQPSTTPSPGPSVAHGDIDGRTANRILGNFSAAYADGDLGRMRALFTRDAVGPNGGGLHSIITEYGRVFATTTERSIAMRDVSWFMNGPTVTIIASYDARVESGSNGVPRRTRGDIRFDLRRQGDEWRIYRLKHDERPG